MENLNPQEMATWLSRYGYMYEGMIDFKGTVTKLIKLQQNQIFEQVYDRLRYIDRYLFKTMFDSTTYKWIVAILKVYFSNKIELILFETTFKLNTVGYFLDKFKVYGREYQFNLSFFGDMDGDEVKAKKKDYMNTSRILVLLKKIVTRSC